MAVGRPIREQLYERHGLANFRHGQPVRLFRRFDRVGPHASGVHACHDRPLRRHRLQYRDTKLRRLLREIIRGRLLDRREAQPEIRPASLRARLVFTDEGAAALACIGDGRKPFTVAAIEQRNAIPSLCPHHVQQVMDLPFTGLDLRALLQRRPDVEPHLATRCCHMVVHNIWPESLPVGE